MTINHSPCRWKQDIALSRFGRDYDVTTRFRSCFVVFIEVVTTSYITRSLGDSDKRSKDHEHFSPLHINQSYSNRTDDIFFWKLLKPLGKPCFTPTLSKLKTCSFMIGIVLLSLCRRYRIHRRKNTSHLIGKVQGSVSIEKFPLLIDGFVSSYSHTCKDGK